MSKAPINRSEDSQVGDRSLEGQTGEFEMPIQDTRESAGPRPLPARDHHSLIVLAGTNVGYLHKINKKTMVIGRSRKADIQVIDHAISRRHVQLEVVDGKVRLVDLGSTNGTYCNGERVQSAMFLKDGDRIQVGGSILKFALCDQLEEAAQQQLIDSALRDPLTQVFNKKYFQQRLESEFTYASRYNSILSLVLFDIDHFKLVNDTYGHPTGDFVLTKLAEVISATIRTEDVLCRYGGEEFAVICRGIDMDGASAFAERLRKFVESRSFVYNGNRISVTISVGIVTMSGGTVIEPVDLVEQADQALYRAKQAGRNRVVKSSATELGVR